VSVDYWWIGCFVDQPMHMRARLQPFFIDASTKSALPDEDPTGSSRRR
jgi:hypothetical protein